MVQPWFDCGPEHEIDYSTGLVVKELGSTLVQPWFSWMTDSVLEHEIGYSTGLVVKKLGSALEPWLRLGSAWES